MEILLRLRRGSAADVRAEMADPPSDSAVRTFLGFLCDKGHLRRRKDGRKFIYAPVVAPGRARKNAFMRLVRTFFGGSTEDAFAYWIDHEAAGLSDAELSRLAAKIEEARRARKQR